MLKRPPITNAALVLLGMWQFLLCRQGVAELHQYVIGFGMVDMLQALGYLVAVWVVLNGPVDRWTLPIIVVCALGCRLIPLFSPPFLSTDIYRYVWDGKVQAAGINPFRYIPADSHMAFLRDNSIYPNINRKKLCAYHLSPGRAVSVSFDHADGRVAPGDEGCDGSAGIAHNLDPGEVAAYGGPAPRAGPAVRLASHDLLGGGEQRARGRSCAASAGPGAALLRAGEARRHRRRPGCCDLNQALPDRSLSCALPA